MRESESKLSNKGNQFARDFYKEILKTSISIFLISILRFLYIQKSSSNLIIT